MRRKEREITSIDEIEKVIKSADVCRIGLTDGDEPYTVPVCFGYERNAIYFHGALEGRKVELIRKNNRVCFEVDADVEIVASEKPCKWTVKYRSVMGTGRAFILESDEAKVWALKLITGKYSGREYDFTKSQADSVSVVKVDIESITGKKSGY
ncbi:pyridoxamine 5'-phosphate oxidase family protein [Chloroflexota bacterium]